MNRFGVRKAVALALAVVAAGCDGFPKDAQRTLERVRAGERPLRVGWSPAEPWVRAEAGADGGPGGIEPDLVRAWAASEGLRIEWVPGGEAQLVQALGRNAIDVAVAGFADGGPWGSKIGQTQPYLKAEAVVGAAPGEAAPRSWKGVEIRYDRRRPDLAAAIRGVGAVPVPADPGGMAPLAAAYAPELGGARPRAHRQVADHRAPRHRHRAGGERAHLRPRPLPPAARGGDRAAPGRGGAPPMTPTAAVEFPAEVEHTYRRARRLAWITVAHGASAAVFLYVTMGTSQAMRTGFFEDAVERRPRGRFPRRHLRSRAAAPGPDYPYGTHRATSIAYLVARFGPVRDGGVPARRGGGEGALRREADDRRRRPVRHRRLGRMADAGGARLHRHSDGAVRPRQASPRAEAARQGAVRGRADDEGGLDDGRARPRRA